MCVDSTLLRYILRISSCWKQIFHAVASQLSDYTAMPASTKPKHDKAEVALLHMHQVTTRTQLQEHTLPFGEPEKPPFAVLNGRPAMRKYVSTLLVNGLTDPASFPTGVKKPVTTISPPGDPLVGEVLREPRFPVNCFCCRNKKKYPIHAANEARSDAATRTCMSARHEQKSILGLR